jgi:Glycerophosphoryl diester phosphodiesterase family
VRVTGAEGDRPVDAPERQAPDSSAAALTRALGRPLDGLETDCCLTADGELVLLHDPRLEVGTTVSGWAHERTAAQIRAGRLRHRDGTPSDERPLLLDELLELAPPGATLQLEVEAHADPALARRTARASGERLRDHPARERTEVIRSGPVHASWPPSSAFGRGWSLSPVTASTRSSPGGDASASTAYASSTSSLARAGRNPPSGRTQRHDRHPTTPQCSSRSCRLASPPSQATPRINYAGRSAAPLSGCHSRPKPPAHAPTEADTLSRRFSRDPLGTKGESAACRLYERGPDVSRAGSSSLSDARPQRGCGGAAC